ncbi:MAG TPA: TadE/TadG family type IV pilus assembly protein [Polyangia bacterium]|nr:TadE/TadG family type IV pilus assembly protein [Polyangia bacterium]
MRLSFSSRLRDPQRGAAAVEFSLVLPALLMVTLGTVDAGRMMVSRIMLAYAVTVGARAAAANANTTTTPVQTAVVAAAPMLSLSAGSVTVGATTAGGAAITPFSARTRGNVVSVSCSYTFKPVTPLLTKLATKTFTYTSKMTIP